MLLDKVSPNLDKVDFTHKLAPSSLFWKRYNDNDGYYLRICQVILFNYLATLRIKDNDKTLVELQELDISLFMGE